MYIISSGACTSPFILRMCPIKISLVFSTGDGTGRRGEGGGEVEVYR